MSYDEMDAAYDQYMSDLYEEHKIEAIEEFTFERLQSYYLANKELAKAPWEALSISNQFLNNNHTVSLIFSAIAIEVGIKSVLLKPIISGLVHSESTASLIADLAVSHMGMNRYKELLFKILFENSGIDILNYSRVNSKNSMWKEIQIIQKQRNNIMHKAQTYEKEEADIANAVATEILRVIFPKVVKNIGFHIHNDYLICDEWRCKYENNNDS